MMIMDPTEKDIMDVINSMTEQDLQEVYSTSYFGDRAGLAENISNNVDMKFVCKDAAIIGAKENSPGVASVFALCSPAFENHILECTKFVKEVLFPTLHTIGHHRLQAAFMQDRPMEKWAKNILKGNLDGVLKGYGKNKESFVLYSWAE